MPDVATRIAENLAAVRRQMAEAAARSHRPAGEIRLVAVTKSASVTSIRALVAAGGCDLGESRPQQLCERAALLAGLPIRWHMIGPLQRNKVRRTLEVAEMVQSVDSVRLAQAMDRIAGELGRSVAVLLEVNVSGDPRKHGLAAGELEPALAALSDLAHLEIRGLMCMAALEDDQDAARRDFSALREIRDRLGLCCPPRVRLDELSMGMSGDFQVAIEEGATIVRIGSTLFEGIPP
jgi:hypothetical protein